MEYFLLETIFPLLLQVPHTHTHFVYLTVTTCVSLLSSFTYSISFRQLVSVLYFPSLLFINSYFLTLSLSPSLILLIQGSGGSNLHLSSLQNHSRRFKETSRVCTRCSHRYDSDVTSHIHSFHSFHAFKVIFLLL